VKLSCDNSFASDHVIFGPKANAVRSLVPSPNGQFLAVIRGEGRTMYSPSVTGVDLFFREGDSFRRLGELREYSDRLFLLNDGRCVVVKSSSRELRFVRYAASVNGIVEESRGVWVQAGGLSEPITMLLAPGNEAIVGTTSRDDGHGWSEPTYTSYWFKVNLLTGAFEEHKDASFDSPARELLGPGVPWATTSDGGAATTLTQLIEALPFRREWARRVGPSRLLTSARVIDVATRATLIGEEPTGPLQVRRVFYDLSPDETLALASDPHGCFEIWNVGQKTFRSLQLPEHRETRCAVFLPDGSAVLGLSSGECAVVRI
jgi:hypothetical protein